MELSIEDAVSEITDLWLDIEGVEGVGQGRLHDMDCIMVFIGGRTPEIEESIPQTYRGFAVQIVETGTIHAE